jgi:ubiquinone/menaquinone biosynthesis C-methylase UbiE
MIKINMKKTKTALLKIKQLGVMGFLIYIIEEKLKIKLALTSKMRWNYSSSSEIKFWDSFFKTKGLRWADSYQLRFDPSLQLQEEVIRLLPKNINHVDILDVGAGPLTYLGKMYKDIEINITAVDPLADDYEKLFKKYNITPLVRTKRIAAEKLSKMFSEDSFDLIFARNCIDHSYSPEKGILEMIKTVKKDCYVLMIHRPNEAINENYEGLHQWNFSSESGDFIISSKKSFLNFSQKYKHICKTSCKIEDRKDGLWLNTEIRKL